MSRCSEWVVDCVCRRAHLRYCLECLKSVVPLRDDVTRHTMLGLLIEAGQFIVVCVAVSRSVLAFVEMNE